MTTVSLAAAYLELLFSPARLSLTAALLLVAAIVAEAGSRLAARVAQSATRDSVLSPHYAHLTTFIDGVAHAPIQHVISFAVAQASAGVIDAGLHAGLHLLRGARLSVPSAASIAMGIYSATSAAFFLGCSMDWFLPRKWRGLSYLLFALTAGMLRVHAAAYDSCPFTLDILLGAAATQLLPCIALGGVAVAVPLLAPSCVLPPLSANTNADAGKGGGGGSGGATLAIARRFALYSALALALACAHVWAEHIGASAVGSMRPLGMCGTAAAAGYNGGTGSSSLSSSSSGVLTACRYALHLALLWWGRSVLRAYVAAVRMVRGKTRMLRARHGLSLSPDSAVWSMLRMRLRAPPQMSKAWRRTLVLLGEIDVIALPWQLLHLIVAQPTTPQPPSPAAAAGAGQQGPSTPSTPPPAPAPVSALDTGLLDPFLKVTSALLNALSTANALSSLVSARTLRASSSFDADVEDQGAGDERGEVHGDEDASNFNLSEQWWEDTTSTSPLDVNGVSLRVVSYQRRTLFGALALPRWMWRRRPLFTLRTRSEWAPQVEVGHNPLPRTRSEWAPQAEVVDNGQPRLRPMRIGLELAVHSSALCRAMRRVERAQNLHVYAPYLSLASRWRELLIHPPPRELFLHPSLLEAATAASAYRDTRAQQGGDSGRKLKLGTGGVDDGLVNEMTIDNDGNSGGGGDGRHRRRLFSGYSSSGGSITDDDDDDDDDSASLDSVDDEDADRDPWEADDVRDELFADTAAAPNAHAVTAQESSSSSRQQRGQASRTSSTFRHSAAPLPYPGASPAAAAAAASFGGAARGGLGGPAGMLSSWSWLAPRVISTLIAITSPSASSPSSVNGGDTQTTTSSGGTRTALLNIGLIDVGRALVAAVRDDASAVASNLTAATALMVDSALGPRRRRRRHEWQGGDDESSDGDGSSDNSGYSSGGGGDGAAVNTHGDTRRRRGRTSNTPVAAAMAALRSTHAWAIAAARHPLRSASSALSALVLGAQSTQTQQRTSGGSGGTAGGTTAAPHSRRRRHRCAWPCGGRPRRRSWVAWVCGRRPRSGPHVEVELVMRSREHDSVSLRVPLLVRTGTVWSGPLLRPELLHELSRAALGAVEGTRRQWMHEAVERVVVRTHGGAAAAAASGSSQDSPAHHTSPSAPAPAMESPNFRNGQRQLQLAMESTACAGELPPSGTEGQLQQRYLLRSSSLGEGTIAPLPVQLHPSSVDGYTSFSYSEPAAAAAAAAASDAVVDQFRYRVNELWNALLVVEGAAPVSSSTSALAISTAAASSAARHRRSDINDAASASADGLDDDATNSSHSLATNNSGIVSTLAKWIHKWKPVLRQLTELWIEENAAAAAVAAVAAVHSGSGTPASSIGTFNASAAGVRGDLTGTTTAAVASVGSSSAVHSDLTHHHALTQEHRLLQTSASAAASRVSHRNSTSQTSPASPPVSRLRAIINAYVHHAVWRFCALEILQRQAQQLVRDARANNFNLGAGRNTGLAMVSLPSRKARPAASAALTANFNLEEEIAWEGDEVAVSETRLRRRQQGNTASSDSSYPQQRATRSSAARRGEGATSTSRQGSLVSASAVEVGRDEALLCAFCVGVTALARTLA